MKLNKPFFVALFGTFVEYYDYALYGFSAPILAAYFFPKGEDPIVSLLQAYGIFLVGSCSKPLGSLIFGYMGDRFGRAFTLKLTIIGIALPTFCIGLLPGYESLGYLAPLLLLIFRVFQGIFVAGESDNARVFLFEMFPENKRCFANSVAYFICMIGIYFASVSASLPNIVKLDKFIPFPFFASWRLCFIVGGCLGVLLFLLRRYLLENELENETYPTTKTHIKTGHGHHFGHLKSDLSLRPRAQRGGKQSRFSNFSLDCFANTRNDASKDGRNDDHGTKTYANASQVRQLEKESFFKFWPFILITLLMTGAAGGQYHFYFVFLNQYLGQVLNQHDVKTTSLITSNLLLCFTLLLPLAGLFADRFAHRFKINSLLKWGALYLIIMASLNILCVTFGKLPSTLMYLTVIGLAFTHANTFVLILDQFPASVRCRGVSIGHSMGSMLFSGTTPFISLWIWKMTELKTGPLFYFLCLCGMSLLALVLLDLKKRHYTVDYGKEPSDKIAVSHQTV